MGESGFDVGAQGVAYGQAEAGRPAEFVFARAARGIGIQRAAPLVVEGVFVAGAELVLGAAFAEIARAGVEAGAGQQRDGMFVRLEGSANFSARPLSPAPRVVVEGALRGASRRRFQGLPNACSSRLAPRPTRSSRSVPYCVVRVPSSSRSRS